MVSCDEFFFFGFENLYFKSALDYCCLRLDHFHTGWSVVSLEES